MVWRLSPDGKTRLYVFRDISAEIVLWLLFRDGFPHAITRARGHSGCRRLFSQFEIRNSHRRPTPFR